MSNVWSNKWRIMVDNWSETMEDNVIKSNMDIGPAKKRRRSVLVSRIVKFTTIMKAEDYDDFEEFYLENNAGVIEFPHPRKKKNVFARFNNVPTANFDQRMMRVNIELEILP